MNHDSNTLRVRSLGIDTYRENIIFMRKDCPICIAEGFTALTRIVVEHEGKRIIATLDVVDVHSGLLQPDEAVLSEIGFKQLGIEEGDLITVEHLKPIESLSDVRAKMYRNKLSGAAFARIITDITNGLYSDIELAAFIAACAGDNLDLDEIIALTMAMTDVGSRLIWESNLVLDKHCVGGLPGNRTTPIVVAIVASAGLTIPKTSSHAITSPAGTADVMQTLTEIDLTVDKIKEVIALENGCIAWGGAMRLSPADDILISVESALDIDSAGQMIASVLSKKAAAGATHVVIDIPVGATAKVRTSDEALKLEYYFKSVGHAIGLQVEVLITDGSQPVGRGIGPALEAMDVLAVLKNEDTAPQDLKEKALAIAGTLLELSGSIVRGEGVTQARVLLEGWKAWEKFQRICLAQGGLKIPVFAKYKADITADRSGTVTAIDNRHLAKAAKLAGAPRNPSAGLCFYTPLGTRIQKGQPLFTLYAEAEGELKYTLDFLKSSNHIITIE